MERSPSACANAVIESTSADESDVAIVIADTTASAAAQRPSSLGQKLTAGERPQTLAEPTIGMTPADVAVVRVSSLIKRKSFMGRRLSARPGSVSSPASSIRLPRQQSTETVPRLVRQRYRLASRELYIELYVLMDVEFVLDT
jgi:hypothetical protein